MSDDLNLAEIEARAEAATEGPWAWEDWERDDGPKEFSLTSPPHTRYGGTSETFHDLRNELIRDDDGYISGEGISKEDRDFIAHARTDIPKLIAAIRARDAEIERLRLHCSEALHCVADNNMSSAYQILKTVGEIVNAD